VTDSPLESVRVGAVRLEIAWHGPRDNAGPVIVMLHEGLGCVSMWHDLPARLAEATGLQVLVYSRAGYGGSDPVSLPRPLTYMQDEARESLPRLLEATGIDDAILFGHSDGASIAIVFAGGSPKVRVRGLVLEAPHVFCEDVSITSIAAARESFHHGDLRARLARHHGDNTDSAFCGWNDAWLDPGFRAWNIEAFLPRLRAPSLVIQSASDPYGTLAQVVAIERGSGGAVRRELIGVGHSPHRDEPEAFIAAVTDFTTSCGG
jgi:pimeloyl-ACP methyl ester carboxylesterase